MMNIQSTTASYQAIAEANLAAQFYQLLARKLPQYRGVQIETQLNFECSNVRNKT